MVDLLKKINLSDKKLFFFDLDGTVYLDNKLIPGVLELFSTLEERKIAYYFYTNNSSKTQNFYIQKLRMFGINTKKEQIFTSSQDTINWLNKNNIHKCYLLGTTAMQKEFHKNGIEHSVHQPQLVVLGYDTSINYRKIKEVSLLFNSGINLVMTHHDLACPTTSGPIPDVGSFLAMFQKIIKINPIRVFGKPSPDNILSMQHKHHCKSHEIVMIGDRLDTDISMARRAKVNSVLVLSGVTHRMKFSNSALSPDFIIESVADIVFC